IYYVSVTGITGTHSAPHLQIKAACRMIRKSTSLPIAVGFGIRSASQVSEIASSADGVVVGSAIVELVEQGVRNGLGSEALISGVLDLVKTLAQASRA
ncbi:MAG: tryptophan synthase subunit alpha, partial [Pseudomonadota bacterium]